MRVLRRRLGLTQAELAFLIGRSQSDVSYVESGLRRPHLAEVLMIELVFGVPAVTIFPEIRQAVGDAMKRRVSQLLADARIAVTIDSPRVSYKSAQLERVLASLRTHDDFDQSEQIQ
jgi:transcriptional regulator with XRE-family HTH domain